VAPACRLGVPPGPAQQLSEPSGRVGRVARYEPLDLGAVHEVNGIGEVSEWERPLPRLPLRPANARGGRQYHPNGHG